MRKISFLLALIFFSAADAKEAPLPSAIGLIPNISDHYQAMPTQYHFAEMPVEKLSDTITRQYIYGSQSMIVKWVFKKGAIIPLHHHVNEQITWITKGSVQVNSQGKTFIVKAGDVITIPPNVPHEFIALEDTIDIDVFSPARQDWIDGSAGYLQQLKK